MLHLTFHVRNLPWYLFDADKYLLTRDQSNFLHICPMIPN